MAYLAGYAMVQTNHYERGMQKPFNPLLGETFEIITDRYQMIAE
jgi:hypothetical protein